MGQSTMIAEEDLECSVKKYWNFDTEWKWDEFESQLSTHSCWSLLGFLESGSEC